MPAALAGVLLAAHAAALSLPPEAADLRPAFLELWINEVPGATSLVLLAPDGDLWISPEDLSRSGLFDVEGARRTIEGRSFVSLRSIAPAVRFSIDERSLAIRISAGPEHLRHSALGFGRGARPLGLESPSDLAVFLNYSARAATDDSHSAAVEAGVSGGRTRVESGATATRSGVVRGLSTLTVDDPRRLVRLLAGDTLVRRDLLGGAPLVAGLTLQRELSLDPYLVRAPLPRASAFAATPSTVEIWRNGTLVSRRPVTPGTYDLSQLPVQAGPNDLQIVVRDAFGRTSQLEVAHYQAQGLLAPGLHDWSWHLGAIRQQYGIASFDYGDPLVAGRHRLGLTDRLTVGAGVEATPHLAHGSASAAFTIPFAEIETAAAASGAGGRAGAAGLVGVLATGRRISAGVDAFVASREYADSGAPAMGERWRAGGWIRFTFGLGTDALVGYTVGGQPLGRSDRIEARASWRAAPSLLLSASAIVDDGPLSPRTTTAFLQLVVPLRDGSTLDLGARQVDRQTSSVVGAQRFLPPGPGVGYRVRGDSAAGGQLSAGIQLQPEFGRIDAEYDRSSSYEVASATASGGLVLVGDHLFATRSVEDGFAVIRVPGVAGVRAYRDQHEMGRTDEGGNLLIPGLIPYYANRLSISDKDVPPSYRVGKTERLVAVPARAGAVVEFDVHPVRAVAGSLSVSGRQGPQVPAYGTLEVDVPGAPIRSPISGDGAFWLEDVPAGSHAARIYWNGSVCEFALSVPASGPGVVDTGTIGCEPTDERL